MIHFHADADTSLFFRTIWMLIYVLGSNINSWMFPSLSDPQLLCYSWLGCVYVEVVVPLLRQTALWILSGTADRWARAGGALAHEWVQMYCVWITLLFHSPATWQIQRVSDGLTAWGGQGAQALVVYHVSCVMFWARVRYLSKHICVLYYSYSRFYRVWQRRSSVGLHINSWCWWKPLTLENKASASWEGSQLHLHCTRR